jgi:hypothetical protein
MCAGKVEPFARRLSVTAGAGAFALFALSAPADCGLAHRSADACASLSLRASTLRNAELVRAFWICDYTATKRGVLATPIAICSDVWNELSHRKFGGNFEELLKWWRLNKLSEHQWLVSEDW